MRSIYFLLIILLASCLPSKSGIDKEIEELKVAMASLKNQDDFDKIMKRIAELGKVYEKETDNKELLKSLSQEFNQNNKPYFKIYLKKNSARLLKDFSNSLPNKDFKAPENKDFIENALMLSAENGFEEGIKYIIEDNKYSDMTPITRAAFRFSLNNPMAIEEIFTLFFGQRPELLTIKTFDYSIEDDFFDDLTKDDSINFQDCHPLIAFLLIGLFNKTRLYDMNDQDLKNVGITKKDNERLNNLVALVLRKSIEQNPSLLINPITIKGGKKNISLSIKELIKKVKENLSQATGEETYKTALKILEILEQTLDNKLIFNNLSNSLQYLASQTI